MSARKPKPQMKVSRTAVEQIGLIRKNHEWKPYEPPPGVVPKTQQRAAMALDSTQYDYLNQQNLISGEAFPGYPYLSLLSQLPEYRKFSETIAKEMTRKWIKLRAKGDEDKSQKVAELEKAFERYQVKTAFRKCAEMDGLFGRGQLYIDVQSPMGGRACDNDQELQTPLILASAKIKKGSLLGLLPIEPMWTYPSVYNADNPLSPDFYRPSRWYVMGKTVHSSRLLSFVSREVPDILKAAYNFGGLSMTQIAQPYVNNWLRTRDSVSDLVHSFSVSGIKTNMSSVLEGGAATDLFARIDLFNKCRDNRSAFVMDKDTEEFFQFATPLSGLDALQAQSQEQMASVSNIPLVKLLGIQPAGLNASADGEIRVFYDHIASMQEMLFSDPLKIVLDVIQLSEFGEIDPDITFEFEPLYALDEVQQSQVRKNDADADVALIGGGVLSPDDSRRRLAADPESLYHGLEVNDELGDGPDLDDDPALRQRKDNIQIKDKVNAAADSKFVESEHPRDDDGKFDEGSGGKKPDRSKAPGSQMSSAVRENLRSAGMVGTFPPADVPMSDVKIADLSKDAETLKFEPLMSWSQTTKSGRVSRQYRYTQAFHDRNAAQKFERVSSIEPHLSKICDSLKSAMKSNDKRTSQAAAIASIIAETGLRPTDGAESVEHGHFGISSLLAKHAKVEGNKIHLDFIGKEGMRNQTTVSDPDNVRFMMKALAGKSGDSPIFDIANSKDAGDVLKAASAEAGGPEDIKIKDLRTVKAAQVARKAVQDYHGTPPPLTGDAKKDKKAIVSAIMDMSSKVAAILNNTPVQARDNYIPPEIFKSWQSTLISQS